MRLLNIWKIKQNFIGIAKWKFSKDDTKIYLVACYQHSVNACGTAVIFKRPLLYFLAYISAWVLGFFWIRDTIKNCCSFPAGTESSFRHWLLKDHLLPVDSLAQIKVNICAWIILTHFLFCYNRSICYLPLLGMHWDKWDGADQNSDSDCCS